MPARPVVAVLGANGFIGSRLVEWLLWNDVATVRPIVRSINSMVRAARFDLDCRVADATDRGGLPLHLKGCEVLFHCVVGPPHTILKSAEVAYQAAADAGVRRLVYLSSAVVHGNNPAPGTREESELVVDQPFEYSVSKVMAEHVLRRVGADGAVEIVTLRPSIVYGPRSTWWTARIATQLLHGTAYLVNGGAGICNTVYVDDLIHAMWLAAVSDKVASQAFIITGSERVTWKDLYARVAEAVGVDISQVHDVDGARALESLLAPPRVAHWIRVVRQVGLATKHIVPPIAITLAKNILPARLTSALRQRWYETHRPPRARNTEKDGARRIPILEPLVVSLQTCEYRLSIDKARDLLGYQPQVSFDEGCRKTQEWLQFAMRDFLPEASRRAQVSPMVVLSNPGPS
jgi:nucleoside-diphosphate-sugar epimerase